MIANKIKDENVAYYVLANIAKCVKSGEYDDRFKKEDVMNALDCLNVDNFEKDGVIFDANNAPHAKIA